MSQKIASMYVEMGADTSKLEAGLSRTKKGLKDTTTTASGVGKSIGDSFSKAAVMVGRVTAAVGLMGATFKGALEFGKEGAQLLYAKDKFDKLSDSIGTTADLLMIDLKNATKGLVSDSELIGSAGDFMALGLAKSHDEVVRLTRVAGALGMNMNQLVLTLTNQTTMRFDALGVSVAGFDEKVKALEATGMSASDAFNEAFLQQAEEQISKIGDKADSTAASFMRLEAATKNLGDEVKTRLAPALANAADAALLILTANDKITEKYKAHNDEMVTMAASYADYVTEMERAAQVAGKWDINFATAEIQGMGVAIDEARRNVGILTEEEWKNERAVRAVEEANRAAADAAAAQREKNLDLYETLGPTTGYMYDLAGAIDTANQRMWDSIPAADAVTDAYAAYKDAQQKLTDAQENYEQGVGGEMKQIFEDAGLSADEYSEVLGIIDELTGTTYQKQLDQTTTLQGLVDLYKAKGPEAFRDGLQGVIDKFGPFDESVMEAKEQVAGLVDEYNKLVSKDVYIRVHTFRYEYDMTPQNDYWKIGNEQNYGKNPGEPGGANGLSMTVPPGYPNDSYRVWASSGEHVEITPQGKTGAGQTINIANVTLPGVRDARGFARELDAYARAQKAGAQYAG